MSCIKVVDPRFLELIDETASFEVLAQGFRFTEGACWHPGEHHVTFTDIPANRIHRWFANDGRTTVIREPSSMTNGTTYDHQGNLLMCEHQSSQVTRLESDGTVSVLASHWQGDELNSPNDIVVDDKGRIWFTDPLYGREAETGTVREPELSFTGVFRIDPDGALSLFADDYQAPNGLCLSLDQKRLFVNDSEHSHIRVHEITADGKLMGGDVFAETRDDDGDLGYGSPDGMKIDASGNIWCAGQGGIHVINPGGELLGVLLTPAFAANFCFGGHDLRTLFVCAVDKLLRIELRGAGHPLFIG